MMAEEWLALQPPTTCGKRPRSPVDKLADLAASAEDDEQDWRSSKRYLTEVIASGFSKLSFKLGMPPHHYQQQQQQQLSTGADAPYHPQQQSSISPKSANWLPGQLGAGAQPLQLPEAVDCPMDMQVSPPTWPQQSQGQHQVQKPAFAGPSPGSSTAGGPVGGTFGGAWSQQDGFAGQQGIGPLGAFAARQTPSPEPCECKPAGSPCMPAAAAGEGPCPLSAAAAATAGAGGVAVDDGGNIRPSLPPLQTAKVLRAAEKQPNSPSDLPAASLRKVALLRSLLARAEQQFHQQQCGSGQPGCGHQLQPTRMQQGSSGLSCVPQDADQQQQQDADVNSSSRPPWMQPWGVVRGINQGQQQQQHEQLPVLPPRPVTPWDMSSDDMDCSSASSVVDSDASSSQQGPLDPGGSQLGLDHDQAASALLCREVLVPAEDEGGSMTQGQQQQQDLRGYGRRARQNVQLPFFSQAAAEQQQGASQCSGGPGQQQQQQRRSSLLAARQGSPELSRQKLEELRAKALASTHQLTCLTQEDLHSLQLGLASRRGSVDSHTPSGLQPSGQQQQVQQGEMDPTPPGLRRHSSHI